jgi:probable F420-dependent oxidoreductase
VRYNLQFPNRAAKFLDSFLGDGRLSDFARIAEEAGFDAVSVYDHPFPPDDFVAAGGHLSLDPFASLAAFAERTERVRLMTNVLVIAYRSPYIAAQALATLDRLSDGRVTAGVAAGYLTGEFQALGARYDDRGARLDEAIEAMGAAWTGTSVARDGAFPAAGNALFPSPVQRPGPPIWIGGNSEPAVRRAIGLADGWIPIPSDETEAAVNKTTVISTVERLAARVADAQARCAELGKPPLEVCFTPFERAIRDPRESFEATAKTLPAYEEAGVTWLTIVPRGRTLAELRDEAALFADTVMGADRTR